MKRNHTSRFSHVLTILGLFILTLVFATSASATSRTFSEGSYIISADSCWQPNNDPATATGNAAICDTNKNDRSIFQVYGLLYALLDTGDKPDKCVNNDGSMPQQKTLFGYCKEIKLYWIIDQTKTDPQTADLTLSTTDATKNPPTGPGIVTIYNSALTKAGSTSASVPYKGGPFIIDANDITAAEFDIIKSKFPAVKLHKANVPFSGNVDKVLVGKPPKIAVLNEGSSDVLEDYIRAAGSFAWKGVVFQYLSARDIIAGCLQDPIPTTCKTRRPDVTAPFQLIWAPHWEIENTWSGESSAPSAADQTSVVREIRAFLEKGSSGFFECASIGSLEGTNSRNQIGMSVAAGVGGYLISSASASPRIENNGGCFKGNNHPSWSGSCDSNYLKFEAVPFWLTQCGGWNYKPQSGLIDSMRPTYNSTTPANSYIYLTTSRTNSSATTEDDRYIGTQMTRFVHDDASKLGNTATTINTYSPGSDSYHVYDYLLGGRINGAPTQGYVIYFPGHKYISCSNSTTFDYPPSRNLEFVFNNDLPANSKIKIEVVHTSCTQGSNCPYVIYDTATGLGTKYTADSKVTLSAEFANFDTATNRLSGVFFTSAFDDTVTTSLRITDIYVTFDGNSGAVKLTNIVDLTEAGKRMSLCAPNATSVYPGTSVRCSLSYPETIISLRFAGDISGAGNKNVKVEAIQSTGRVSAQFDLSSGTGTLSSETGMNMWLDLRSATYNPTSYTLDNIRILRGASCADITLTDIAVTYGDFGNTITLDQIVNETTKEVLCSPKMSSVATCSGTYSPPPSGSKTFYADQAFRYAYVSGTPLKNSTKITFEISYSCGTGCSGTVTATYDTSVSPNVGEVKSDSNFTLDLSSVAWTNSNKTLSNIKMIVKDITKIFKITKVKVTFDSSKQLKKFSETNVSTIYDFNNANSSPASATVSYDLVTTASTVATYPTSWSALLGSGICSYYISPYLSSCTINWNGSNTCGIKYVLNTFLALKYSTTSNEFTKTQPVVKDNILYKASFEYPSYRGHLRMIKVPTATSTSSELVWDAASAMPSAGASNFPTAPLSSLDTSSPRYIFTNLPGSTSHVNFIASNAASLKTALGAASDDTAAVIINTARGRKSASTSDVYGSTSSCTGSPDGVLDTYGCDEDSKRLWGIENSTPALKTKSKYVESTASSVTTAEITAGKDRRDRFLFAGADDGMMHAFWAGHYDSSTGTYPDTTSGQGSGKEIWAYLPSSLLSNIKNQPFNPDPSNESTFEPKISVDGSPALGDFLICPSSQQVLSGGKLVRCNDKVVDGVTKSGWEWRTRLVGTAMIRSQNRGIVFALDVTNPYDPQLLWEGTYDKTTDTGCSGTSKNCNMGNSMGVSIGTAQIGDQLKDYVFLTSSWINKKKVRMSGASPVVDSSTNEYLYDVCSTGDTDPTCVYGVSAYALDIETGKVMWERSLPYSGDAVNVNVTPAVPALMDRDNNGSFDYVVFGDMQGRLWALRTTDGKNLTDNFTATNHISIPVYQVKTLDSDGKESASSTPVGAKEPIAAAVSVYRDYVVIATGGADYASNGSATDGQRYRIEVVKISLTGGTKQENQTVVLEGYDSTSKKGNEKVWAKPAISSDLKVYVGTARSYYSNATVATQQSDGRVIVIDLRTERNAASKTSNILSLSSGSSNLNNVDVVGGASGQWQTGGFVGGIDFDNRHAYIVTLKPSKDASGKNVDILQIGGSNFSPSTNKANPFKILWWRKM